MTTVTTPTDDYASSFSNILNGSQQPGVVAVGGQISGNLETSGDHDWFKLTLTAGVTYLFELDGAAAGGGSFGANGGQLVLRWYSERGQNLGSTATGGTNGAALTGFTPSTSGTYYVEALDSFSFFKGTYTLKLSTAAQQDDYGDTTATKGVLAVGGSVTGNLENPNDHDWFKVHLQAGQRYTYGLVDGGGSLSTVGADGTKVNVSTMSSGANPQLGGGGVSSANGFIQGSCVPLVSGDYYLNVNDFNQKGTGTYTLQLVQTAPAFNSIYTVSAEPTIPSGRIDVLFEGLVTRGAGTLLLKDVNGNTIGSYDVATSPNITTSTNASGNGGSLTLTPTVELPGLAHYMLSLSAGAVVDAAGHASSAVSKDFLWVGSPVPTFNYVPGTAGNDTLVGSTVRDILTGGTGNDTLDGGAGFDMAFYYGNFSDFKLSPLAGRSGVLVLADQRTSADSAGADQLSNVERLQFTDTRVALDMDPAQAAGKAALALGATLGLAGLANKGLAGAFVRYFDNGGVLADGVKLLVDAGIVAAFAGGTDNTAFVNFVYNNVMGHLPDAATLATLVAPLNAHFTTQAQWMAGMATSADNQQHVGLAGLAQAGWQYLP